MKYLRSVFCQLAISFVFITLVSCINKVNTTVETHTPNDTTKHYLALGDSYTIGQSVSPLDRFPEQLVRLLRAKNILVIDPDIVATTGWTTGNLIQSLENTPPKNNYSLVTLLIGVNNQYQGRSISEYRTEFQYLLNRAILYAGNNKRNVFVLSIPDYSVTPFAANSDTARIAREIDEFNLVNKEISQQLEVRWLDITPISREAKTDRTLLANDGLHPSSSQYSLWVEKLSQLIN